MDKKDITELLDKVKAGTASPGEEAAVKRWLHQLNEDGASGLSDEDLTQGRLAMWQAIQSAQQVKTHRLWPRIAVAASILLALSFGGYFLLHKEQPVQIAQNDPEQIAPVQNSVVLTLAKGRKIILGQKHSGQLTSEQGAQISQQDSLLSYRGKAIKEPELNTLTNNGSGKFSLTLTDGTVAILDIGSSLTYPAAFGSGTRRVSMTGQAYFKVKHLTGQAFEVAYDGQTTEDIGTEFNINAYKDEPAVKTTLIEGSIRVDKKVTLKPGEQAIKHQDDENLSVKTVNLEDVTAWLQSQLIFHHETLENILRDVARIYNVTIVWQDQDVRKLTFGGSVTRNEKLATVLNYFRKAGGVDFRVEGKTVKVFKPKK